VPIQSKLLQPGEAVVVDVRTHAKALLLPAVWLVLVAAVAGYASSLPRGDSAGTVVAVVWGIALVVLLVVAVRPFLVWLTTTYTVTDRRLITRTGVLSRRGHDIPVPRISDVAYEHGLVDRMLGCGTLVISDASEQGRVRLPDIPHVEHVHLAISDLLFGHTRDYGSREHSLDDGT
jgi:uncharacterized membrane protein YdbT with pleckstrin-like domain